MFRRAVLFSPVVFSATLALLCLSTSTLWSQSVQGSVNVVVTDPAGGLIPDAKLELKASATNDLRTGASQEKGTYRFVGLSIGNYALTITKEGFAKTVVNPVVVEATRTTDVAVQLTLATTATSVEVTSTAAPVLEISSNMIGTTLDVKQIESLPLGGRNLTQLAQLAPGYNGTWNGAPSVAQGNNIDGIIASPSRMKFTGNSNPSIAPRLENIAEMTVQTDQLDVDQGFGQATMQISFITRSGSNQFHGRLYEDFRNKALNANTWANNGRGIARAPYILNDFGGSVGGPIVKNKLFFFASFGMSKQPGSITASNSVLSSAAQAGNFTYVLGNGSTNTVNVLNAAKNFSASLPSTVNPIIASQIANINGALTGGVVTASTDPNINNLNWLVSSPVTNYYPAGRVDYNASDKLRFHLTFNQQRRIQPSSGAPAFPGTYFANQAAGFKSNGTTYSLGIDYTVTPAVVNQFKAGFLYNPVYNPWYQVRRCGPHPSVSRIGPWLALEQIIPSPFPTTTQ